MNKTIHQTQPPQLLRPRLKKQLKLQLLLISQTVKLEMLLKLLLIRIPLPMQTTVN